MDAQEKNVAPSVATVDSHELLSKVLKWEESKRGAPAMAAWNEIIAHIDAHVAAQVAAKDAEIKTLKAVLDAQGELTDRYQEIALSAQEAAPVVAKPVDADAMRAAGRAEAMEILMQLDPESGIDEYTGWGKSGAPEDEGSAYWKVDKLRELFSVDGSLADMMDKAEGEYWHYKGLQMEAEHAKNFAANMHNSGKVREVLAKAGEYDLMADLCRASQPSPSPAPVAMTDEQISKAARHYSNKTAEACGVDPDDQWMVYGGQYIDYFREAIIAAQQEAV